MRLRVSPPMRARLDEYDGFHRSAGNERCHCVGVPSIVTGAGTLLGALPFLSLASLTITAAELVAGAIILFYLVSARVLGLVTGVLLGLLVALGRNLPFLVGTVLFFGGWVMQFVGHAVYEKRSPAFAKNLLHLLVGPAWLVERAITRLSRSR
jgi:uncharacterized membrane protein YGL010W